MVEQAAATAARSFRISCGKGNYRHLARRFPPHVEELDACFIVRAHQLALSGPEGPRAMRMLNIIVLGCVLAAVAITLKVRIDTPQGPQPLTRALVTTHLQQLRGDLALP